YGNRLVFRGDGLSSLPVSSGGDAAAGGGAAEWHGAGWHGAGWLDHDPSGRNRRECEPLFHRRTHHRPGVAAVRLWETSSRTWKQSGRYTDRRRPCYGRGQWGALLPTTAALPLPHANRRY